MKNLKNKIKEKWQAKKTELAAQIKDVNGTELSKLPLSLRSLITNYMAQKGFKSPDELRWYLIKRLEKYISKKNELRTAAY